MRSVYLFLVALTSSPELLIQAYLHDILEIALWLVLKEEHTQFQLTSLKMLMRKWSIALLWTLLHQEHTSHNMNKRFPLLNFYSHCLFVGCQRRYIALSNTREESLRKMKGWTHKLGTWLCPPNLEKVRCCDEQVVPPWWSPSAMIGTGNCPGMQRRGEEGKAASWR